MERLEVAKRFFEAVRLQVVTGSADVERLYHWSFRLLDVERDMDRVSGYEKHLARMRRLEADIATRRAADLVPEVEDEAARFFGAEAVYWLALAEEGDAAEAVAAQVEQARAVTAAAAARFEELVAWSVESPCLWSVRLLQAERDADPGREAAHYQAHLDRLLALERTVNRRQRGGEGPLVDAHVVEFFRWEAEFWQSLLSADTARRRTRSGAFAEKRHYAARLVFQGLRRGFEAGVGEAEHLYLWSLRLLRAARDRDEEEGGTTSELSALEEHHERMTGLQSELRTSHPIGVALDLGALEYFVLEAAAWLEQARTASQTGPV